MKAITRSKELLDELDATPFGQVGKKLDNIASLHGQTTRHLTRGAQMLKIAAEIIRENCSDATYHYDETDCDGLCIADDCEAAAEELES